MTKFSLHTASAPMFTVMLNNMNAWLDKAEAHAKEKNIDVEALLNARLIADQLPFKDQINFATAFAKNTMCRLAGETPPDYPNTDASVAQLRARITRTLDIVASASADAINAAENRDITFGLGPDKKLTLSGQDYFLRFALPNFYFHATTAYDILRANGVALGKMDFMGAAFTLPN
ncbi:MAG TPA: DUF1993 domain-containing protein [Vitreimonas sp.]|jgi:hypothetical protein|nr:DUF1993 domain-containing protein [Vitreimonas sp.]